MEVAPRRAARLLMKGGPYGPLYRWCRRFVAHCEGTDNTDMASNGELRMLRCAIPECHVVFDIGANVGEWSQRVSEINPLIDLHCFEPNGAAFRRLLERQLTASVVRNPFGLSSQPGIRPMYVFGAADGMNSLYRREGLASLGVCEQTTEEPVELRTLDGYCDENGIESVDFIKMDVEGHELEVLRGGTGLLQPGRARFVQLEYGGCNIDARVFLKDLFAVTAGWPYDWYKVLPGGLRRIPEYSQQLENFRYSNWLLVRRGERPL